MFQAGQHLAFDLVMAIMLQLDGPRRACADADSTTLAKAGFNPCRASQLAYAGMLPGHARRSVWAKAHAGQAANALFRLHLCDDTA